MTRGVLHMRSLMLPSLLPLLPLLLLWPSGDGVRLAGRCVRHTSQRKAAATALRSAASSAGWLAGWAAATAQRGSSGCLLVLLHHRARSSACVWRYGGTSLPSCIIHLVTRFLNHYRRLLNHYRVTGVHLPTSHLHHLQPVAVSQSTWLLFKGAAALMPWQVQGPE